jgi:isocitrate dehydrogenase kinase/phosphatase
LSESGRALEGLIGKAARAIGSAFVDYLGEFHAITQQAKTRFETCDWHGHQQDALERLELYARSMEHLTLELRQVLGKLVSSREVWTRIKQAYAKDCNERNFELARTYFNSVTRVVFATVGVNPDIEFTALDLAIHDWEPEPRFLRRYPSREDTRVLLAQILEDYRFDADYRDLQEDVRLTAQRMECRLEQTSGSKRIDAVELLRPVFYRNKAAYIMGRILSGENSVPLVLALLNSESGVFVDAVLMREVDVSILFSFTRSHFHVDLECPREAIVLLKTIIPLKPVNELYGVLGYHKHGKTELYRSLQRHLSRTSDRFEIAAGDPGMVMLVFTLPSFDRVFKVIRDSFAFPKNTTARDVKKRYRLVFKRDRVGRLVEAQLFKHLKIKLDRFEDDLLDELLREASRAVKREGDFLVFGHLYMERKVTPLNLYLHEADEKTAREAVVDYGAAIKELAAANIFPGDFLLKNFGVTRHGRVVFYDYDELCLLTDCKFRRMPTPRTPEEELASEPWFAVADNDVFPEEFRKFLGLPEPLFGVFDELHGDVFKSEFWRDLQVLHREGAILDFYPYPDSERLRAGEST